MCTRVHTCAHVCVRGCVHICTCTHVVRVCVRVHVCVCLPSTPSRSDAQALVALGLLALADRL